MIIVIGGLSVPWSVVQVVFFIVVGVVAVAAVLGAAYLVSPRCASLLRSAGSFLRSIEF